MTDSATLETPAIRAVTRDGRMVLDLIAEQLGHRTDQAKWSYWGLNEASWYRLKRGEQPGVRSIASIMARLSHATDALPFTVTLADVLTTTQDVTA